MARLSKEELEKIKEKYGADELFSWSKVNCFMTSPYEFYLKYILHKKEDADNCAYAPMGGICHEIIERFYGDEIQYNDMANEFEDGWLTAVDIADLKFDRNDETKNENIKAKYKDNLIHFFKNHEKIEDSILLEKFVATKIGDYVLQGYIDAIRKDKDENYHIIDWKTSTKYSGKTLEEKSGQLCVYAMGVNQLGVPLEKIKICFNFLKYCTIQYEQANGKIKTRDVERHKIGESLQSNAKVWLKKFGYEDEIDDYLMKLLDTNSIECLPKEVREKYVISDCYVYQPLTQEFVDKWTNEIVATIKDIKLREKDYEETHSEKIWWDSEDSVKSESYYFSTLCGYSPNLHKPYAEYLNKLEASKSGNIFGEVSSTTSSKVIENNNNEVDLSWLDNI